MFKNLIFRAIKIKNLSKKDCHEFNQIQKYDLQPNYWHNHHHHTNPSPGGGILNCYHLT